MSRYPDVAWSGALVVPKVNALFKFGVLLGGVQHVTWEWNSSFVNV